MHIYKLFAGLFTLSLSYISTFPVLATELSEKDKCILETRRVAQKFVENRNVKIRLNVINISEYEENYPYNRPLAFLFSFEGNAAGNIMSSPQFLQIATKRIINNCANVSKVSFGEYATDENVTIGLMHDGSVKEFKCFSPSELTVSSKLKWGEEICI
jgi:hypothetical protein